jgi:hypothetical protein
MDHPPHTRVLQVRVAGADCQARAVVGYLAAYYAYLAKNTNTATRFTVRRHVWSTRRAGDIRAYLTIIREEHPSDAHGASAGRR